MESSDSLRYSQRQKNKVKPSSSMITFNMSCHFKFLTSLFFIVRPLAADSNSLFDYQSFDKHSNFDLYGDAKVMDNGSSLQLTNSVSSRTGSVMYKNPIKLVEGNKTWRLVSFSTYFEFSLSSGNGNSLAFIMVPRGYKDKVFGNNSYGGLKENKAEFLAVEFNDLRNDVRIHVGSFVSVKAKNLSLSGQKLCSWIDYQASSKSLEVRLGKLGDHKPVEPLLYYIVDFAKLWKDEEVFIGIRASNMNLSSQMCYIYSWSLKLRHIPQWMHSMPIDVKAFEMEKKKGNVYKSNCVFRILGALIFGTLCGVLGGFIVLYLWRIFGNRRPVVPEEFVVEPEELKYKEVKVVVNNSIDK